MCQINLDLYKAGYTNRGGLRIKIQSDYDCIYHVILNPTKLSPKKYFDLKWTKYLGVSLSFSCQALWRIHYNFLALGLQMHNNIPWGCDLCTNYHRPLYRIHLQDISLPNYHSITISAFDVLSKMLISFSILAFEIDICKMVGCLNFVIPLEL